jgi:undecaprenyl phosphate-alpha-L-ara4FN deformylase
MRLGLRVDVDTLRGTREGVPALCGLLERQGLRASFFFSLGPDNMGRHLWRLLRPGFLAKMLRSRAPSLYGWDILLRGTLWPGPLIGEEGAEAIRLAAAGGHEIGLHAWDHHAWQTRLDRTSVEAIRESLRRGCERLEEITGEHPACSAVAGWRCDGRTLREKARLPFRYNSDCRGESVFLPMVGGEVLAQPQIPTTLPTYDELIGREGLDDEAYNERLLSLLRQEGLNVLTIHAEVEGGRCLGLFEHFLEATRARGIEIVPLVELLGEEPPAERASLARGRVPGREGWLSVQGGEAAR